MMKLNVILNVFILDGTIMLIIAGIIVTVVVIVIIMPMQTKTRAMNSMTKDLKEGKLLKSK